MKSTTRQRMWTPAKFALCAAFLLAAVAALGAMVMLLWNAVMPAVFDGARPIGYLHALGLLALCRILFGGFRGRGGSWHHHHHERRQRWLAMTPEEREACKRGPWGRPRPPQDSEPT